MSLNHMAEEESGGLSAIVEAMVMRNLCQNSSWNWSESSRPSDARGSREKQAYRPIEMGVGAHCLESLTNLLSAPS